MLINTPWVGSQSAAWWPAGYPTIPRGGLLGIYRKQAGRYEALPLPRPMKGAQILIVSDGGGIPPERPRPLPNEASDVRRSHYLRRGSVLYIYTERRRARVG